MGQIGVMDGQISHGDRGAALEAAAELEDLGYSTIWLPGSQSNILPRIADVVRATRRIPVASGILPVNQTPADEVAQTYAELNTTDPGRFIVGLGGAHGPKPLETLGAYLDQLDAAEPAVPAEARLLAALGPKMLELARDRTAGAFPFLVTPSYVARARELLTDDSTLVIGAAIILESDPGKARAIARGTLGFLKSLPAYRASFRRMGFTDDEIADASDRLVDGVTVWGDDDKVAARIDEYLKAGADQVALNVAADRDDVLPRQEWQRLASALIR
jgi:probable F420-dependent oxidoreductase